MLASPKSLDVLVVEHQVDRSRRLADLLAAESGLRMVGSAPDGAAALMLLRSARPGVVLMRTALPRMDGLTTLRILSRSSRVPVVMLSVEDEVEGLLDALALGAVGYLDVDDPPDHQRDGLRSYLDTMVSGQAPVWSGSLGGSPGTDPMEVAVIAAGALRGLSERLRQHPPEQDGGCYWVLDAPPWLIDPVCRRLHRTTPWRVLRATDGDRLAPGHVLVAAARDRLQPVRDGDRVRLRAGASWRDVTGAARILIGGSDALGEGPTLVPDAA